MEKNDLLGKLHKLEVFMSLLYFIYVIQKLSRNNASSTGNS
jgi:hypothetical protein